MDDCSADLLQAALHRSSSLGREGRLSQLLGNGALGEEFYKFSVVAGEVLCKGLVQPAPLLFGSLGGWQHPCRRYVVLGRCGCSCGLLGTWNGILLTALLN